MVVSEELQTPEPAAASIAELGVALVTVHVVAADDPLYKHLITSMLTSDNNAVHG
jgi:hypothetical protein